MKKIIVTQNKKAPMDDFYGIFFEDINHAADGGLYAEKLRNRSFEFSPMDNHAYHALTAWKKIEEGGAAVSASVSNCKPYTKKNPNYLVMEISEPGTRAGIKNLGYNSGISVEENASYNFSCIAAAERSCTITVSVDDAYGRTICSDKITVNSAEWKKYTLTLTSPEACHSAVLAITSGEKCKFRLSFVSLFPKDTFMGRENGMRKDLAELLADLKPKFMRFPGGCLVHDGTLNSDDRNSMYRWKNTIGEVEKRPARRNNWRYNQSLGLGYYEYFLFCEDIGAKPLPVLPAGYNPHMEQSAPLDEMQEWIDDALDLIEFANGGIDTKWGKIRADLGHEQPFNLTYLAIGNEEVGKGFWERYDLFHKQIREKYPEIKLINSAGPFPAGGEFERGWANARKNGSDLVDEHYYTSPEWMLANTHRYDDYESSPKVFLGEYASWGNTYYNALAEAAYMTSLENNAEKIGLVCYAPLFANVDYVDWKPDMIWFDNHRSYGSANYFVQKMFMTHTGDNLLETESENFGAPIVTGSGTISGDIEIMADRIDGKVYDICVTDMTNGKSEKFDDIIFGNSDTCKITNINSTHYKIEFKAIRNFGNTGFRLFAGKRDDKNFIQWFIGGWQNQDTELNSTVGGRGSTLSHNIFSLMTGREYSFCLEIDGRNITSYIDGKVANTATDRLPQLEELYFTASSDEKNLYIKAVNVRAEAASAVISLCGAEKIEAQVQTLTADPGDENSFDNPVKVAPVVSEFTANSNEFEYTFPPQSVTVFKIKNEFETEIG